MKNETEIVEFKEAKNTYEFSKLGKYFSALSNEANLQRKPYAWLVFGIVDKSHKIVGTQYRNNQKDLHSLKHEMAEKTNNRISFLEIYELFEPEGRVVMFQIPAAPKGVPTSFQGHFYGREGESLGALNMNEYEAIRRQQGIEDWSAAIVHNANISDLDPKAIVVARYNFKFKFPHLANDVDTWDDITFLNKAKVTEKGKITRTAILLLGNDESDTYINPSQAIIRWILKDAKNKERDYLIAGCPLLLAIDAVYAKIRNVKYRYIRGGTLFPNEMDTYEPFVIREAINNCIAHQDYTLNGRINVVEFDDHLVFSNLGSFIPGNVKKVIDENVPYENVRNPFLVRAMFNLNLVDTIGSGVRKIFNYQRERFFPMPDYELSENRVKVIITGKVTDTRYAKILEHNSDLSLDDVLLLDKVQKQKPLTKDEEKYLRKLKLIEGRKPNYYLSLRSIEKIDEKATKTYDKQDYIDLILRHIKKNKSATRKDIDELLWDKLPEEMDDKQRKIRITNFVSKLRKMKVIKNIGTDKNSQWVFVDNKNYK
ncbi:MAG: putative DNA binding domain-containing protein [Marinilabiliaceae bacterium]|nr:putative DNA binding domain-containing protein [Marinilabiliaceae bacterium]